MLLFIFATTSILAVSNSVDVVETNGLDLETMLSSIEDVGDYHTDAFLELTDLYAQQELRPKSRSDLQRDVNDIVSSHCGLPEEEQQQLCFSHVHRVVDAEFRLSEQQPQPTQSMTIPDDMDPELRQFLTELHDTMDNHCGDAMVLEELVSDLQTRVHGYEPDDDHNYCYKIAILGGVAVALESCRMWHEVYENVDHPLYGLHSEDGSFYIQTPPHERQRRQLQNPYEGLQPQVIARADVVTAIATAVNNLLDNLTNLNNNTFAFLSDVAAGSIAASAAVITNYDNAPSVSNAPSSMIR